MPARTEQVTTFASAASNLDQLMNRKQQVIYRKKTVWQTEVSSPLTPKRSQTTVFAL
jgi:hypothetical protein